MFKEKRVTTVVLAAGSGSRMSLETNKVYLTLRHGGVPALHYSLSALEQNGYVDDIVIAIRREDRAQIESIIAHERFPQKPVWIVEGGEQRSDSVRNALEMTSGDIVVIHDGARPLLRQRYITGCIEAMETEMGAIIAIPCRGPLYTAHADGSLTETGRGARLYRAQTPQCFHAAVLRECYEKTEGGAAVTDDSSLLERCGYRVKILPGDETNIKLTYPADVFLAHQYISEDEELSAII